MGQMMSKKKLPIELIYDTKLSSNARFLYIVIFQAEPKEIPFSYLLILMQCSRDTLLKYTQELIDAGYISKTQTTQLNSKFGPNKYTILK